MANFIEALKVIFLGIVEGITEWLPISSTGHMLLVDQFLQLNESQDFKDMFLLLFSSSNYGCRAVILEQNVAFSARCQ